MCSFFFLFSLSCVKSPSFTLSPCHPPPFVVVSQDLLPRWGPPTQCPLATSKLKSQLEKEHGCCPRYQPNLMVVPPLIGFFTSPGSLPPFVQVASPPALDTRDSTAKNTPGLGAESHGKQRTSFQVSAPWSMVLAVVRISRSISPKAWGDCSEKWKPLELNVSGRASHLQGAHASALVRKYKVRYLISLPPAPQPREGKKIEQ